MIVLSVDPGVVNIGVCVMDTDARRVLYADRLCFAKRMRDVPEGKMVERIEELFFHPSSRAPGLGKHLPRVQVVLIEQQMKRRFLIFQHALAAFARAKGLKYQFVSPTSVKRHFKIAHHASPAKKGKTRKVVTAEQKLLNYEANKRGAVEVLRAQFPEAVERARMAMGSARVKVDDLADAVLMAAWFADKERAAAEAAARKTKLNAEKARKRAAREAKAARAAEALRLKGAAAALRALK
ncbi:Hypothetical Protein FCC1311_048222 [Hondaea fermentalgiana]|uniref:Holliday junction resolvase RuvC n=1 Tax=Hondaea fermentalgiana TaxID=2315210 RepID=A0A2R5GJZ8_9STRA|nr:Hypothetical Protein FCC1311_048222 [Hondaea fermentalgiana]|eukprot:GBG28601.1 Hypothetical Protein FCC1311_048222 [Hondaea fermentalgiana]